MNRLILSFGLVSVLSTFACGKNDCEDGYERIKAKYDDCRVEVPSTISDPGDSECTELQGDSLQNLAESVETGTCDNLRALSGQK